MDSNARRYFDQLEIDCADCEVEVDGENNVNCDCCNQLSRTVWCYVHRRDAETIASYYVQWTEGASLGTHPANIDLIIGPWGDDAVPENRCAVSMINFENENGLGTMVINASDRPIAHNGNVGIVTTREDVVGTPLAKTVFTLVDAILLGDARLYCVSMNDG